MTLIMVTQLTYITKLTGMDSPSTAEVVDVSSRWWALWLTKPSNCDFAASEGVLAHHPYSVSYDAT